VELSGYGASGQAAVVGGAPLKVLPQAGLLLTAPDAIVESGKVARFEWRAVQPVGSQSVMRPSSRDPQLRFEPNVAGAYEFELLTWDQADQPAFQPLYLVVEAAPVAAIHIELLWDTPDDADQTNEGPNVGTDFDLHVTHPFAAGEDIDADGTPDGWFDKSFDLYWYSDPTNWRQLDPTAHDAPTLDRVDEDGAGPENLNLHLPEDGRTYRIGAHYWGAHGFGCSYATIRVYIYGKLTCEKAGVPMARLDFWEVATIDWPSGDVTPIVDVSGGPRVVPAVTGPVPPDPGPPAAGR
jgi:hypothetical protein